METQINGRILRQNDYPRLMESKEECTRIVLFFAEGEGVVITGKQLGNSSNTWLMDCFIPFKGEVIIRQ